MSLTQEQVKHIANLSRLKLDEKEVEGYQKDLNSIVGYVDMLSKIPDSELNKVSINEDEIIPLREDIVQKDLHASRDELLNCSSKKIVNNSISINNIME